MAAQHGIRQAGLVAAALLALTTVAQASDGPPYYEVPCSEALMKSGRSLRCGRVIVPQDRKFPQGLKVALPVVVVRAATPRAGALPVVYLHGGPGGGVVAELPEYLETPFGRELVALDQDWIFFDQRGADAAEPALDCGDLALNDAGPESTAVVVELSACARRWKDAGVDFRQYTSAEVALDIQDIRRALHLGPVAVYGFSYGTRVASALLSHAPAGVDAVVFDSPWPPEALWTESGPGLVSREVRQVLAECRADADCGSRYGGLEDRLDGLFRKLLAAPIQSGDRQFTSDMLALFLMDALYEPESVRSLPRSIQRLTNGDFTVLTKYADGSASADYAEALHMAVLCNEELPFEDPARVRAQAAGDPIAESVARTMTNYFSACAAFDHIAPDPLEQAAVRSDVPALFLAAGIDAGCPVELSESAVRNFARGQLVVVPQATHGVSRNSPCGRKLARAFLSDPLASVDRRCLAGEADGLRFD